MRNSYKMRFPDWLDVRGDTTYRGPCPLEQMEQITLVNRVRSKWPDTLGKVLVHVRNEGKRTRGQAHYHKAEGMTSGACDVFIPGCPALLIELKRRDHTKSRWQPDQLEYMEAAQVMGAFVCVALGADAAMRAIADWRELLYNTTNTQANI